MTAIDYLVFDDALRDTTVRPAFDRALAAVADGTAGAVILRGSSTKGFVVDGHRILGTSLLQYGISLTPAAEFDAGSARELCERMRALLGWNEIGHTLRVWVEKRLGTPFFVNTGTEWDPDWTLRPDADPTGIPDSYFEFACYVAIGELKHGPSYASVSANRIFDWVEKLGSDLPARLRTHGTGELPPELTAFRADGVSASANDALAVIRLRIAEESEAAYATALDYLARLLESTDFPRSYAIEFRGPTKTYLPVKGLPKKGVHQLFAAAAAYPALHPAIERYARGAMREDEWYLDLDDENCAMPGTFAVFALAFADPASAPLVVEYLSAVDGEHQSLHGAFVEAYLDARGFTPEAIAYLLACAGNIQHLRHRKTYPAMIASPASLDALLSARAAAAADPPSGIAALRANLSEEPVCDYAWRAARFAIWGEAAERDRGRRVIASAPEELRTRYEAVFDDGPRR